MIGAGDLRKFGQRLLELFNAMANWVEGFALLMEEVESLKARVAELEAELAQAQRLES